MTKQRGNIDGFMTVLLFIMGLVIIFLFLFGWPQYKVWQQGMVGEANLAKADQTRKILISQARAEREAAVEQAEAIKIVGQAAKDFPEYRQQQFMNAYAEALQSDKIEKIVYVATEAGIPITESGRVRNE